MKLCGGFVIPLVLDPVVLMASIVSVSGRVALMAFAKDIVMASAVR